jgi:hypothetical protein
VKNTLYINLIATFGVLVSFHVESAAKEVCGASQPPDPRQLRKSKERREFRRRVAETLPHWRLVVICARHVRLLGLGYDPTWAYHSSGDGVEFDPKEVLGRS